MDSDHASASNMDVLESDLDHVDTDMPSASATDGSAVPNLF